MSSRPDAPEEPDLTSGPTHGPAHGSELHHGFGPYQFLHRLGEGGMGGCGSPSRLGQFVGRSR